MTYIVDPISLEILNGAILGQSAPPVCPPHVTFEECECAVVRPPCAECERM